MVKPTCTARCEGQLDEVNFPSWLRGKENLRAIRKRGKHVTGNALQTSCQTLKSVQGISFHIGQT